MEVKITRTTEKWLAVSGVSRETVESVVRQPTRQLILEVADFLVVVMYRWFSSDFVVYATAHVPRGKWSRTVNGYDICETQTGAVLRLWVGGPVGGIRKGLTANEFSHAVNSALSRPLSTEEQREIDRTNALEETGDLICQTVGTGSAKTLLSLDKYRRSLAALTLPLDSLPSIAPLRNEAIPVCEQLRSMCNELSSLLQSKPSEEQLHQWLWHECHRVFIDPMFKEVRSKVSFGAHVSDFVVTRADGTYVLIEIEPSHGNIFKKDGTFSQHFNHALHQVRDWQNYIRDNVRTVRAEQNLPDISQPRGAVIMGVANEIEVLPSKSRSEAKRRWRDAKACDPVPMNWHELIDRVRTLADQLETVERAMGHPKKSATQHLKKMPLRSEGLSDMFSSLS